MILPIVLVCSTVVGFCGDLFSDIRTIMCPDMSSFYLLLSTIQHFDWRMEQLPPTCNKAESVGFTLGRGFRFGVKIL